MLGNASSCTFYWNTLRSANAPSQAGRGRPAWSTAVCRDTFERHRFERLIMLLRPLVLLAFSSTLPAQTKSRARELGLSAKIGGTPGTLDAITDVAGVEVGHTTL